MLHFSWCATEQMTTSCVVTQPTNQVPLGLGHCCGPSDVEDRNITQIQKYFVFTHIRSPTWLTASLRLVSSSLEYNTWLAKIRNLFKRTKLILHVSYTVINSVARTCSRFEVLPVSLKKGVCLQYEDPVGTNFLYSDERWHHVHGALHQAVTHDFSLVSSSASCKPCCFF